jgi:hypothetical protein
MPGKLTAAEASPVRIYALLQPNDDLIKGLRASPWSEALRVGRQYDNAVGEISSAEDIAQLPVDVYVRAVGLVVAGVTTIRWMDPQKASWLLPGVTHDYFLDLDDQSDETRSGWLVRTGEGVEVN